MASLCPRCLSQIPLGSSTCPECGAEQSASNWIAAPPPPPPPGTASGVGLGSFQAAAPAQPPASAGANSKRPPPFVGGANPKAPQAPSPAPDAGNFGLLGPSAIPAAPVAAPTAPPEATTVSATAAVPPPPSANPVEVPTPSDAPTSLDDMLGLSALPITLSPDADSATEELPNAESPTEESPDSESPTETTDPPSATTPPTPQVPLSLPVQHVLPAQPAQPNGSIDTISTRGLHRRRSDRKKGLAGHKGLVAIGVVAVAAAVVISVIAIGSSPKSNGTALQAADHKTKTSTTIPPKKVVTAKPVKSTPTVAVALHSGSQDPRPIIAIRIGNDKPINVVLDTGSVGLRVFSNMVPTGVGKAINVTTTQDSAEYADGTTLNGPVSFALIHIGKLTTTQVVPFELAQSVTCDPDIPVCPAEAGAQGQEMLGIDGIMGIGLGGNYQGDPTTNPLLLLPAPYRNGWSISMSGGGATLPATGALVLGAHDPGNPAAQFALQQGEGANDGMPTWDDFFNLCWDVGGLNDCDLTVFDSGTSLTILEGNAFANAGTDDPGETALLNSNTSIQCAQEEDGNPLWSFSSGSGPLSTVLVEPEGADIINSGAVAFYSFKVTYDEAHGDIYLS